MVIGLTDKSITYVRSTADEIYYVGDLHLDEEGNLCDENGDIEVLNSAIKKLAASKMELCEAFVIIIKLSPVHTRRVVFDKYAYVISFLRNQGLEATVKGAIWKNDDLICIGEIIDGECL